MGEDYAEATPIREGSGAIILASREGRLLDKVEFTQSISDYETLSRYAALIAGISDAAGVQLGMGRPLEIDVMFAENRVRVLVEPELLRLLVE